MRSVRRALARLLARAANFVSPEFMVGCACCGAAGAHLIVFDPKAQGAWLRCKPCADTLFEDDRPDGMAAVLAEAGASWAFLPGAPLYSPDVVEEIMDDLRAHSIPFFPPVPA